jgi:hypothetical protein
VRRLFFLVITGSLFVIQATSMHAEIVQAGTPSEHAIHKDKIYEVVKKTITDINSGKFKRPLEVILPNGEGGDGQKTTNYIPYVKETFLYCKEFREYRGSAGDTEREVAYMAAGYSYSCNGLKDTQARDLFVVLNDSFEPIAIFITKSVAFTVAPQGEGD